MEKYDRVTEILSPFSGINVIPQQVLENAQVRGTKVHAACESILRGLGEWHEDEIQGYVDSFKQWWVPEYKVVAIEQRFNCPALKITGQIDFIYKDPEFGHVLTDIKTSVKQGRTWPLQGSAYKYLAERSGYKINKIMFIRLRKNGEFPFVNIYEDNFPLFSKCLDVYRYFYNRDNYEPEQKAA